MSQASYVAAFLFIGFLVFITIRGELPQYRAAVFGGDVASTPKADEKTADVQATALTALVPLVTF